MTLRQQQPAIRGMFHQLSTCLYQPLLQARQQPLLNSLRQRRPTATSSPGCKRSHTQLEPHFVRQKAMTSQASHLDGLLAFFNPHFLSDFPGTCGRRASLYGGDGSRNSPERGKKKCLARLGLLLALQSLHLIKRTRGGSKSVYTSSPAVRKSSKTARMRSPISVPPGSRG